MGSFPLLSMICSCLSPVKKLCGAANKKFLVLNCSSPAVVLFVRYESFFKSLTQKACIIIMELVKNSDPYKY
jgi:hypothetical protein